MPKLCLTADVKDIIAISEHKHCDAICLSNTIPWGLLPSRIPWKDLFGSEISPLEKFGFGKGGLSGTPLLPLLCECIEKLVNHGLKKPLCAGGGILKASDVDSVHRALGHKKNCSISIGSIGMLRPWNMEPVINRAYELFK